MDKQEIIKLANEIHKMHSDLYEDGICFRSFADSYNDQAFMCVHDHSDSWSISFSPTKLFEDGALEIQSDGRLNLTILSDHKTAWNKAITTLKERHKIITKSFNEIDLIEKNNEKDRMIKELESQLEKLKNK